MMKNRMILEDFSDAVNSVVSKKIIEEKIGNQIEIVEEQNVTKRNGKNTKVTIKRLGNDCFAFKLDFTPHNVYLFERPTMINDELIIRVEDEKLTVFLIELKSDDTSKAKKQIRYGKRYADFLINILELEMNYFFKEKEYRGYICTTNRNAPRPVVRSEHLKKEKKDKVVDGIYIKYFRKAPSYDFGELGLDIK